MIAAVFYSSCEEYKLLSVVMISPLWFPESLNFSLSSPSHPSELKLVQGPSSFPLGLQQLDTRHVEWMKE